MQRVYIKQAKAIPVACPSTSSLKNSMQVDFYRHDLNALSTEAFARVIETPFITSGSVGREVEARIAAYFGVAHAALVNSWTNGALAALLALDIGPGDEVIVPAMTFIASANVAEILGAKPVFVDVDPESLMLTPEAVLAALTEKTRAVIPVHLYGQMTDMAGLRAALVTRPDIAIVEDCAHCFEGERDGDKPGAHSACAIFSFYATKNVTCGEGGALITDDKALYEKFLATRLHGMSAGAFDRFGGGSYRHWDMVRLGVKANLPDLLACLLPAQIATIDSRLQHRERIAVRYEEAFAGTPIRILPRNGNSKHARHLFVVHLPEVRDRVLALLAERKIGCAVNFRSVPTLTYYAEKYGYTPEDFPVSYEWGAGTLSLPFYPSLTLEKQDYVIKVMREEVVPMVESAV
jgi:UDP-4-amino-4-deoxy-L-arabinose-oxoglutarate aminotransferase